MATIFTKIINGDIPCYKIAEDERYFAFLDINPLHEGHTLIIPKVEEDYIFNLEDDLFAGMFVFAKKIALAIDKVIPSKRVGVAILGLEVPHAHIHLVPLQSEGQLNFANPKLEFKPEEFEATANKIKGAL